MENKEYSDWRNFGIRVKNSRNSIGMTVEKLAERSNRTDKSSDYLLFGNDMKTEEINYSDKEIINNILNQCNERQLKIIKDVLIALFPNFDDLQK